MQPEILEIDYNKQSPAVDHHTPTWQNTLWREWRNSQDEEYARRLFNLVAGEQEK